MRQVFVGRISKETALLLLVKVYQFRYCQKRRFLLVTSVTTGGKSIAFYYIVLLLATEIGRFYLVISFPIALVLAVKVYQYNSISVYKLLEEASCPCLYH